MNARKLLSAAKAVEPVFIEDTFSSYLYTGNGSTQTITNGIDLSGKGGLVWIKSRSLGTAGYEHLLTDTAKGVNSQLNTASTAAATAYTNALTAFNSAGFSLAARTPVNASPETYVSWTFREQAKFFDVVTYTGNGANRTIAHNLGSVPGCIIVKRTDTTADWQVYHRSIANTEYLVLNDTAAKATGTTRWNSTTPTATEFSLGTDTTVNANTGTYVAYLFAHDAGGFGASGADNVISCGSFTANGSGQATISVSYEPQLILVKRTDATSTWFMIDNMRGFPVSGTASQYLSPNTSTAENGTLNFNITNTGFYYDGAASSSWIYIAIRRGPMKTPTTGTSVFSPSIYTGDNATPRYFTGLSFSPDMVFNLIRNQAGVEPVDVFDRLRGANVLRTANTNAEASTGTGGVQLGYQSNAIQLGSSSATWNNSSPYLYGFNLFRRAPGFFDEVCDTGTSAAKQISHNLTVAPEFIIRKSRSNAYNWQVWHKDISGGSYLTSVAWSTGSGLWTNGTVNMNSSSFSVAASAEINASGDNFVSYLFATCPGVSKVGSYTGTGNTLQIDCGFTGGARFVLIKKTSGTGDWYVWDSSRGIVAGSDPYLTLNTTAAEVTTTDWVDTYSAGFELSNAGGNNANINTASYIFLAIA